MTATLAAVAFALASAVLIAFQIGLALGAPWGIYAMGGAHPGRFPPKLRVGALVQAVVVACLGLVVLSDADLVWPQLVDGLPVLVWVPVAFSGVAVVLNAVTPSAAERRLWLPVALVMLISSVLVALS